MDALKWLQEQIGIKAPWVVERLQSLEYKYVKRNKCIPIHELDKVNEWILKHIITKAYINNIEYDTDPVVNPDWATALIQPNLQVCCSSSGGVWDSIVCNQSVCCDYYYKGLHVWLTDNTTCYSSYGYKSSPTYSYGSSYILITASIQVQANFTIQGVIIASTSTGSSCTSVSCQSGTCSNCDIPILYNQVNISATSGTIYSVAYQVQVA